MGGGGGKSATSSSQVSIPPEVMAQYNAVNTQAEQTAQTPFQQYSTNPDAFVAPLTNTQQAAETNINNAQGVATPYLNAGLQQEQSYQNPAGDITNSGLQAGNSALGAAGRSASGAAGTGSNYLNAATGYTQAGGQAVNPTALGAAQINQFMSPYNQDVVNSTMAQVQQQEGQQSSALSGQQIMSGAFGGSRSSLDQAQLSNQQALANAQIVSGLENQNYSQALSAAQQQQGVGLSAGQANRAATQQTGQSLAALGQQGYTQGMGLSTQQAALGGQDYSQSLGAANQLAALGQQGYQDITNTGTTAQSTALAGAQAQMGAGTVEQQTQQAGDTALYNQFLQQQGYPFQVDQFLAGIAEGTGQLSGSSTTSTQPTSFFGGLSDARMKEDIEPVGKTFDGQNIIKFRYKGEKKKQIGLVAQQVEQTHPEAVRENKGLKYVDYDKATALAAARGHFASGGYTTTSTTQGYDPNNSTIDPSTMQSILQSQKSMYPYNSETGSRTGGGGGPWGTTLAQSGSHKLMTAPAPKINQQNDLHALAGAINDSESIVGHDINDKGSATGLTAIYNAAKSVGAPTPDALPSSASWTGDDAFYRGGLVRKRYASGGGMPYQTDDPYVPDDDDQLPSPQALQAAKAIQSGGQGGLAGAASTVKDVTTLAKAAGDVADLLPFARGGVAGRKGYQAGSSVAPYEGDVNDLGYPSDSDNDTAGGTVAPDGTWIPRKPDSSVDEEIPFEKSTLGKWLSKSAENYADRPAQPDLSGFNEDNTAPIANWIKRNITGGTTHTPISNSKSSDWNGSSGALSDPNVNATPAKSLGDTRVGAPPAAIPAPPLPPAQQVGPVPTATPLQSDDDTPLTGSGALGAAQTPAATPSSQPTPSSAASSSSGSGSGQNQPGWFGRNKDWLVPLLKGVGTAAASPSRYLGAAVLQGAGAGAGAYQQQQQASAQQQLTQANAANTNQEAFNKWAQNYTANGYALVKDPNGPLISPTDGQHYLAVNKLSPQITGASGGPSASGAPTYKYLGPTGMQQINGDPSTGTGALQFQKGVSQNPAIAGQQNDMIDKVKSEGIAARDDLPSLQEYESAMMANSSGPLQLGAFNGLKTKAFNYYNSLVGSVIQDPEKAKKLQINPNGEDQSVIATKMSLFRAAAAASGANQNSLGALEDFIGSNPNPDMPRGAVSNMLALLHSNDIQKIDKMNYLNEYDDANQKIGGVGTPRSFYAQNALDAFGNDHKTTDYENDRNNLNKVLSSPAYNGIVANLQSPNVALAQKQADALDKKFGKNFHRYFTGAA